MNLGRLPYSAAHEAMVAVLTDRIAGRCGDTLILCEHEPVFTVGTQRNAGDNVLEAGPIPVVEVRRGGDVTFHGPGQLVGYPILALPEHRHDLHGYLRGLEQMLIDTLSDLGIAGTRDERNTGVWVDGKKIAAIGIACRRWVTWHGFALNLTTDLGPYQQINPCGLERGLVTRLADHLDPCPPMPEIESRVVGHLATWWREWSDGDDSHNGGSP
jgi:lipoyl(octanoyl) transferase